MDYFYETSIVEKLPFVFIIIFLIIIIALLMFDRQNLVEISERQDTIKAKIDGIDLPPCPACPACPANPDCPMMSCPEVKCPKCPEHPECKDIVCAESNENSNKECPESPECPECPECPKCPLLEDYDAPTANEIVKAIFPGRQDGILFSGEYYPVSNKTEKYVSRKSSSYSNKSNMSQEPSNSNIVPLTDAFMGGYAPFNNKDPIIPEDNSYPVNLTPNKSNNTNKSNNSNNTN